MLFNLLKISAPIEARFEEISSLMGAGNLSSDQYIALSTEFAEIEPIVILVRKYKDYNKQMEELEDLLKDPDFKEEAQQEKETLKTKLQILENDIKVALIPKDKNDIKNAILELRAGTGGDEAALFANDLFAMYKGVASQNKWSFDLMELAENDLGGIREAIINISGKGAYGALKYESGVHRVQRIPATETGGRIHTSAATVAVLPEAEDIDLDLDEKDLRVDVYRAQGAGGQHVNKTESAVRITHLPTGVAVAIQDEKSQHKNKAKAMKILQSRLLDEQIRSAQSERAEDRKNQVGSGDRSERIRTYNFPQGRVTDHRINKTLYKLEDILSGVALKEFTDALMAAENAERLAESSI